MGRNDIPDLVNVPQAADLLGFTDRHIRNLIEDNLLPATRVGKSFVIKRSDLAKVKRRKPGPKAKAAK